jgi:hypothetical protein
MPSNLYLSLITVNDIRRRRLCEAAEYRQARAARRAAATGAGVRTRGEPAGCPPAPRHWPRWLALP